MKKIHYIWVLLLTLLAAEAQAARPYGGFYTPERIAALRRNCDQYAWAGQQRQAVVERARPWAEKTELQLWAMVPGQDLPRCIDVTFDRLTTGPKTLGCLKCGDKIARHGNYPYDPDFEGKPWKLTCPSCGVVFPTNDFARYYASAIDEKGLFNPAKGDKSLLFNTDHPDPKDPLHKFGVDDGFGYIDQNGRSHKFVGYYSWKYWDYLLSGLGLLADAYLYTGEQHYARKAAILLDRMADVYPDMDWAPYAKRGWYHSDGGGMKGKIQGSIWETSGVQRMADSYDKILGGTQNDEKLFRFLKEQGRKYQLPTPKGSRDLFVASVDERILRTAYRAVLSEQIRGNQGMHQLTVATCAVALNTEPETSQWLDWLFAPDGGAIPGLMISQFDRDGTSDEGAPGYAFMWGQLITRLATLLADYPAYTRHNIFREFPQFSATFLSAYRMAALGRYIPNIGDTGATGAANSGYLNPQFMALGFQYTRDPDLALAAYRANGNSAAGLGRNIYAADPEALSREIARVAAGAAAPASGGTLMSGFGLARLETGSGKTGLALTGSFGRTIKHAHPDLLNFDLFAFGTWLAPDHGYPEFATRIPSNTEWTGSTLSHNTVFVDQHPQKEGWGGFTRLFKQLPGFGVYELDGRPAYPDLQTYSRTMMLVGGNEGDSDAYVVDIFRVAGGQEHLYSFHGPPGAVTSQGLQLSAQAGGTYAGEQVAKGTWSKGFPVGYSHLYNVRRDARPPARFMVDWQAEAGYRGLTDQDGVHLRLHSLTPAAEVAMADGDPPQNKAGNPRTLPYLLQRRSGANLQSTFVSVIEPYRHQPFIRSVERVDDGKGEGVALRIERQDGRVDHVVYHPSGQQAVRLPQGGEMSGKVAFLQETGGQVSKALLIDGRDLRHGKLKLKGPGAITGKVVKMNKEVAGGGWILVDTPLPLDGSLTGEQILISPGGERDATYTIRSVERQGELTKVYCGPISFVRGYKGGEIMVRGAKVPKDYTGGYLYDFEEGAAFRISTHSAWPKQGSSAE
ncbi:MAG: heparinase II/III domain-containing protein [Adhaeribacter sp.]